MKPPLNEDGEPIFYIAKVGPPDHYPRHIVGDLKARYDHLYCLYFQLKDLWEFQLKNHRDIWNLQAAHEFWWQHGPKTVEGRKFAWNPEPGSNWILDAMDTTRDQLEDLEQDAKYRMRAIGIVTGDYFGKRNAYPKGARASAGASRRTLNPRPLPVPRSYGFDTGPTSDVFTTSRDHLNTTSRRGFEHEAHQAPGLCRPEHHPNLQQSSNHNSRLGCLEDPIIIDDDFQEMLEFSKRACPSPTDDHYHYDPLRDFSPSTRGFHPRNNTPENTPVRPVNEREKSPEFDVSEGGGGNIDPKEVKKHEEAQMSSTTSSPTKKRNRSEGEFEGSRSKKSPKRVDTLRLEETSVAVTTSQDDDKESIGKRETSLGGNVVSLSTECDVSSDGTI